VTDARRLAWQAQQRIDHDGAFANLVVPRLLDRHPTLDARDRAFVTNLVYGTTRMRRACDFLVDRFLLREPDPAIRSLLRLGAHQLHFGGVAPHAAVGETVALAPPKARGFVNAVLRKVATAPVTWPDEATRLSYPDWVVARLAAELGADDAHAALERMNEPPPVTERADGYVQDRASAWIADAVGARPGERVVELCAAPGGKATAMAHTGAFVAAGDLQEHRARLIAANARLTGTSANLAAFVADATRPPFAPGSVDRVLVDAPCSGLGALRRRPDARWHVTPEAIDALAALQERILEAAAPLLRPGGVLVYSVCTLTAAESIDHDRGARAAWPVLPPPGAPFVPYGRGARLLPQAADTDGMVLLRWQR
jgi:16S rRNA (cytosine967-C5)-methyltransferase